MTPAVLRVLPMAGRGSTPLPLLAVSRHCCSSPAPPAIPAPVGTVVLAPVVLMVVGGVVEVVGWAVWGVLVAMGVAVVVVW